MIFFCTTKTNFVRSFQKTYIYYFFIHNFKINNNKINSMPRQSKIFSLLKNDIYRDMVGCVIFDSFSLLAPLPSSVFLLPGKRPRLRLCSSTGRRTKERKLGRLKKSNHRYGVSNNKSQWRFSCLYFNLLVCWQNGIIVLVQKIMYLPRKWKTHYLKLGGSLKFDKNINNFKPN